jgi:hypothetical protein
MTTTALAPYSLMTSGVDLYIRSDKTGQDWGGQRFMSCMDGRREPVERLEMRGYVGLGSKLPSHVCSFKRSTLFSGTDLCITTDPFALFIVILVLLTTY